MGKDRMGTEGFTLIELLLVVSIIGILITLLLPRFEDVQERANLKVCVGNLRGLANAMAAYEASRNVTVDWGESSTGTDRAKSLLDWQYLAVEPYCPYAPSSTESQGSGDRYTLNDGTSTTPDYATCPYADSTTPVDNSDHKWP